MAQKNGKLMEILTYTNKLLGHYEDKYGGNVNVKKGDIKVLGWS